MMDRIDFLATMVPRCPRGGGNWLDACTPFVDHRLSAAAAEKGYACLAVVDLEPRTADVKKTDLRAFDVGLGEFDLVTSSDTLEHIEGHKVAIASLFKYCRVGGTCIVGVPSLWLATDLDHVRIDPATCPHRHVWRFSPSMLERELEEAGFTVVASYLPRTLDVHEVCCFWFLKKKTKGVTA